MKAVNWNTQEDMTNMFWRQNISQMWVETEFKVSKDIASWKTLTEDEKNTFKRALAGLTGLDTHQADDGMPLIMLHTTDLRKKAVYSFMQMMEQIHAKSYSHIFTTLLPSSETNYLLDTWVIEEPHLKHLQLNRYHHITYVYTIPHFYIVLLTTYTFLYQLFVFHFLIAHYVNFEHLNR